jgi:hypothetical protein
MGRATSYAVRARKHVGASESGLVDDREPVPEFCSKSADQPSSLGIVLG